MATESITFITFTAGTTIVSDDIDSNFAAINTLLTTTKIGTGNLQAPKALFGVPFQWDSIGTGASKTATYHVPAGIAIVPVEFTACADSITDSPILQVAVTDDGANVITSSPLASPDPAVAGTVYTTTSFDITSIAGGSKIVVTVTEGGGGGTDALGDVTVMLWFKAEHQA